MPKEDHAPSLKSSMTTTYSHLDDSERHLEQAQGLASPSQIIDSNGVYSLDIAHNKLNAIATSAGDNANYVVVAVLGPQATGKSTLLNGMFGTKFTTMLASEGRHQTTCGIWMDAISIPPGPVVVLDVEGTDSRERGDSHARFESQTSLFSLVVADLLIVNMWTSDVGRHDAANYALLREVFTQKLHLFSDETRSTAGGPAESSIKSSLCFVFRDHDQASDGTPLHMLADLVFRDVHQIWDTIPKPNGLGSPPPRPTPQYVPNFIRVSTNNSNLIMHRPNGHVGPHSMDAYFWLSFASLPPRSYEKVGFEHQIQALKESLFMDTENWSCLTSSRAASNIGLSELPSYMSNVWSSIAECQVFELPSHQTIISSYRCDQAVKTIFRDFSASIANLQSLLEADAAIAPDDFAQAVNACLVRLFEKYHSSTLHCLPEVRDDRRDQLASEASLVWSNTLNTILQPLIWTRIERFATASTSALQAVRDRCMETCDVSLYSDRLNETMAAVSHYARSWSPFRNQECPIETLAFPALDLGEYFALKIVSFYDAIKLEAAATLLARHVAELEAFVLDWLHVNLNRFEWPSSDCRPTAVFGDVSPRLWKRFRAAFSAHLDTVIAAIGEATEQLRFRTVDPEALRQVARVERRNLASFYNQRGPNDSPWPDDVTEVDFRLVVRDALIVKLLAIMASQAERIDSIIYRTFDKHFQFDGEAPRRFSTPEQLETCYEDTLNRVHVTLDYMSICRLNPDYQFASLFEGGASPLVVISKDEMAKRDLPADAIIISRDNLWGAVMRLEAHCLPVRRQAEGQLPSTGLHSAILLFVILFFAWNGISGLLKHPFAFAIALLLTLGLHLRARSGHLVDAIDTAKSSLVPFLQWGGVRAARLASSTLGWGGNPQRPAHRSAAAEPRSGGTATQGASGRSNAFAT